jgi:hypothetical protein
MFNGRKSSTAHARRLGGGECNEGCPRWRPENFLAPVIVLALALGPASPLVRAQAPAPSNGANDSGVFEILVAKRSIGTERFQIRSSPAGWEATGALQLEPSGGAKVEESSTLRLSTALRPMEYERVQKTPLAAKLQAQIGTQETTLVSTAGEESAEQVFYLPEQSLVLLDTNFFHHYGVLLRLYDQVKGGVQPFNVFIPQEALPGAINLQFLGKESVAVGQATKELDHYQASTDEHQIEIWATPEGAIQRLAIPTAGLEVLRK